MASLLNNASLLLNPAGSIIAYEEDKIFSVLPSNGTGDFTFSGGDGGTRVNQQGYIEQTPANLMTYSEVVSNWTGNLFNNWIVCAVTSDIVVAPNGTLTGDRIGDGYGSFNQSAPAAPGQTYTYSVYLKNVDLSANFYVYVAWGLNGTLVSYVTAGSQIDVSTLSTSEWTRLTFTATAPASGINQMQFGPCPFTGYGTNPSGRKLDVWGGMINIGSTALPYQPTTDRLNYPRITYQNGRGALLSEPQRTNYVLSSNSCAWSTQVGASLTFSSSISPDGTQNATTLSVGTGAFSGTYYYVNRGTEVATVSIFAKAGTLPYLYFVNVAGSIPVAWFNLANGTIGTVVGGYTAKIEPFKDGWYRCSLTNTSQTNNYLQIGASDADNDNSASYAGSIYIWGGQNEVGGFATSYIPTTSATVTRPADSTNNTNATSVIGQTEGVIYSDLYFEPNGVERNYIYLNDSTGYTAGFCYLVGSTTNRLILDLYNNPYTQQFSAQSAVLTSGRYKAAIAYKQNDFAFYLNGVQIATDNNGTIPTLDRVYIGQGSDLGFATGAPVFTTSLFNTRLTNTQLAELTTIRSGSGGNISYYGPYTIHTFQGSGTFTPSFTGPVEVLVVAGGGGGGFDFGGGGGAGGLLYTSAYGVSAGTGITVTIGAGGVGAPTSGQSTSGGNSAFGGLTAIGGGGGANGSGANVYGLVKSGGSGGGAGGWDNALRTVSGSGIPGQGFDGGIGDPSTTSGGAGGGGGAGQKGQNSVGLSPSGDGGDGLPYSITGFSNYYAGGGGGGTYPGTSVAGVGGLGGGGNGAAGINVNGYSATAYTGGGGGGNSGGGGGSGGNGGAGIVIVRYLT